MNYLLQIRTEMAMSQSKLATYLGVSKSLIYHIEKRLRSMSAKVMIKLGEIYIRFAKLAGTVTVTDEQRQKEQSFISRQVNKFKRTKEKAVHKIELLKYKLKKMKRNFNKCRAMNITNCAVAENIKYGNPSNGEDLWLAVNVIDTNAAWKRCNRSMQEETAAKIKVLEANVIAMDDFIQKNTKCIEWPVMMMREAV